MTRVLGLVAAVVLAGCRLGVGGAHGGVPPRAGQSVRLVLHALDERAGPLVAAAFAGDGRVGIEPFDPAVNDGERAMCGSVMCPSGLDPACAHARARGADYYAVATLGSRFDSDFRCTQHELSLSKKGDACVDGVTENERSKAEFDLRLYDVWTCRDVGALHTTVTQTVKGPREQSEAEAVERVIARVPAALAGLFPDQVVVERPDQVPRGTDHGVSRGSVYALFRERQFRGYLHVTKPQPQASAVEPLTCCFLPQPGDVLVSRGRHVLVDLVPLATIETIGADAAFGGALHLRVHPMDGGWMVGLAGDLASSPSDDTWQVTAEGGYELRPNPRWEIAGIAGAGFGGRRHEGETSTDHGVQASVLARGGYHILPYWFITFDAGWITSTYGVDGPVLRLGTGFRL